MCDKNKTIPGVNVAQLLLKEDYLNTLCFSDSGYYFLIALCKRRTDHVYFYICDFSGS